MMLDPTGRRRAAGLVSRAVTVRELDRRLIEEVGVPAEVLMEHAGHRCADLLRERFPDATRVRVLCGPGNNGGDGYVLARHLHIAGLTVAVEPLAPPRTPEAAAHAQVAARLGLIRPVDAPGAPGRRWFDGPDLIVDAVYGTGQRGPIVLPDAFRARAEGAPVVALDVPTGIDADTGARLDGGLPWPSFVICIGRLKPFLFAGPSVAWAFADIGLEQVTRADETAEAMLVEAVPPADVPPDADKWARGHVGLVAGGEEMAGAAVLAGVGALRAGAGLVTLFIPREAWPRLAQLPPEIIVRERDAVDTDTRCDALVVGPGLGRADDARVRRMWVGEPRPCVFDADALRALVANDGTVPSRAGRPRLLTPHAGEAAALLGRAPGVRSTDRLADAARLRSLAPTILKGPCPIVTGAPLSILRGFLPQLGTGGSGDVLAGVAGAELARAARGCALDDATIEQAALRATWRHLRAAERAGSVGITAREIADALVGT